MECMACFESMPAGTEICPRCGFVHYQVIGDTGEAKSAFERMAANHRKAFLHSFDLGVTVYSWKDQDGTIVLDQQKRMSFGRADALLDGEVWLDQHFARVPQDTLTVDLSVRKEDGRERMIPISIPALREKQLQRLGITLGQDLRVCLNLKNEQSRTASQPVAFL